MSPVYQIKDILKYLPHRYPFVMIDRVLELEPGRRIVTLKNVTINEPYFQGHFPGNPIMPGVLILEAMAQSAGVLTYESLPEDKREVLIYFMAIDKAKFRRMVVPGDQLRFEIEILKLKSKAVKGAGKAYVENKLVAEAEMIASIGEKV
ncbi:MAG: 3-hydroxyacyl-ACP dehydratase FabZ [Desulfosarcina sp.]|nr:3-hydroxyacyl-ACP dehydratase FabZ [Desulfobacterales bacterium]